LLKSRTHDLQKKFCTTEEGGWKNPCGHIMADRRPLSCEFPRNCKGGGIHLPVGQKRRFFAPYCPDRRIIKPSESVQNRLSASIFVYIKCSSCLSADPVIYVFLKRKENSMAEKPVLTIKETSREFNFPEYAIRTLVKRQAFPVIQVGNRCYICRDVFQNYLESGGALYNPKII
jgi:hypothetical protein